MRHVSAQAVRLLILSSLEAQLTAVGLTQTDIPDDFDLLTEGVIDSLGILQLITLIEEHFDIKIDFADLTPENLTIVGPFSRYIEERAPSALPYDP